MSKKKLVRAMALTVALGVIISNLGFNIKKTQAATVEENILTGIIPTSNVEIINPRLATDGIVSDSNSTYTEMGSNLSGSGDGSYDTNTPVYLQYDFGKIKEVTSINILRNTYPNAKVYYRDAKIELSTESNFSPESTITVFSEDNYLEPEEGQIIKLPNPVDARYIRIWGRGHDIINNPPSTWRGYSHWVRYSEIRVNAVKEGEDLKPIKKNIALEKIPASSGKGLENIEAINDESFDNNYATHISTGSQWLQFDYRNQYYISDITFKLKPGTYNNMKIEVGLDPYLSSGKVIIFNEDNYVQTDEAKTITLKTPVRASHIRFTTGNTEENTSYSEVAINANLSPDIIYDESKPEYKTPAGTLYNKLVWEDNFDGETIDDSKWQIIDGFANYAAVYQKDAVSIVRDPSNSQNGLLNIKSKYVGSSIVEEADKYPNIALDSNYVQWQSGRVETKNKISFLNGRIAARMKVNDSQGIWPAFWMLAQDEKSADEIDILEYLGQEMYTAYATNHYGIWGRPGHGSQGSNIKYYEPLSMDFHVYEVEWRPDVIIFYLDGEEIFRTSRGVQGMHPRPMFLILETQVGGGWVGPVNTNMTKQESDFQIDWVKVYQNDNTDNVFFDDLTDFSKTYSHTNNLTLATDNPFYYYYGGQPRVENSRVALTEDAKKTKENIIYNLNNLKDFHITAYYSTLEGVTAPNGEGVSKYTDELALKFYVASTDNGPWKEVTPEVVRNWLDPYPAKDRVIFDGFNLPEGSNFLKIEFPTIGESYKDIELAKVTLVQSKAEVKVDKVKGFKAVENTNSSIKLTWNMLVDGAPVEEYLIYKDGKEIATVNGREALEYKVTNLKANTLYNFKIVAKGFDGQKGRPVAINARTTK